MDEATATKASSRPIALILGATPAQWRQFGAAIERAGYRVILAGSTTALAESRPARRADLIVYRGDLEEAAVLVEYRTLPHRPAVVRLVEALAFPEEGFDPSESDPCDVTVLEQRLRRRLSPADEPDSVEGDSLQPQESAGRDPLPSGPTGETARVRSREVPSPAKQPLLALHQARRRPLVWMAVLLIVILVLGGMWRGRSASGAALPPVGAASEIDLTAEIVEIVPSQPMPGEAVNIHVAIHNRGTQPVTEPFWVDLYLGPQERPAPNRPWPEISAYGATWLVEELGAGGTRLLESLDADAARSNLARLPPGPHWDLYVLVDSYGKTSSGAVVEGNEENNLGRLFLTSR